MALYGQAGGTLSPSLALYMAALVAWVISQVFPVLSFELNGQVVDATIATGVITLTNQGKWEIALAVLLCATIMPGLKILGSIVSNIAALRNWHSPLILRVCKLTERVTPFAMVEVYLLGVIVAYVKMADFGQLTVGIGTFGAVAAVFLIAGGDSEVNTEERWAALGDKSVDRSGEAVVQSAGAVCHDCGWLSVKAHGKCPRCASTLHPRKPESLQRTWALALAAVVLYIPANLYPVMIITQFGQEQPATIIEGVVELAGAGMYPIAALVFTASIVVPIMKLIGIFWLLITVQIGSTINLPARTRTFAVIEGIGRWSMVDVFMISILAGMIQLGGLFTIEAGSGAIAFCGVVLITMLASQSFDSRLMWDQLKERHD